MFEPCNSFLTKVRESQGTLPEKLGGNPENKWKSYFPIFNKSSFLLGRQCFWIYYNTVFFFFRWMNWKDCRHLGKLSRIPMMLVSFSHIFCESWRSTRIVTQDLYLKLVSAIFYKIFISSSNDRPSKTMKNVFYFIEKALFVLEIFKFS